MERRKLSSIQFFVYFFSLCLSGIFGFIDPPVPNEAFKQSVTYIGGDFSAFSSNTLIEGLGVFSDGMWTKVDGSPKSCGRVNYIASNGSLLYIAGKFKQVDGLDANSVVRYDTKDDVFSILCGAIYGDILWVQAYKDSVYVCGSFNSAKNCGGGSVIVNNIAVFSTTSNQWFSLGSGIPYSRVDSLAVVTVDNVRKVYAVGVSVKDLSPFISVWTSNTGKWTPIDGTLGEESYNRYLVLAIHPQNNDVYVGGSFTSIGGSSANCFAKFNNETDVWESVGNGFALACEVFAIDFVKNNIIVAGWIPGFRFNNIAYWNGSKWLDMAGGVNGIHLNACDLTVNAKVKDVSVWQDRVYISGQFSSAGTLSVSNIAVYDFSDNKWESVIPANSSLFSNSILYSNAVTEDGELFVMGQDLAVFDYSEFPVDGLVFGKFTQGGNWTKVTDDLMGFLDSGKVHAIAQNGTDVIVAGKFITAGSQKIVNLAKWDGQTWWALGDGIMGGVIYAVAVSGHDLYIGGNFNYTTSTGKRLISVARYSSLENKWYDLDDGINGDCSFNNSVYTIAATPSYIYVGGSFGSIGSVTNSPNLARWNLKTSKWESVGAGLTGERALVRTFFINSTRLYIGGRFYNPQTNGSNLAIFDLTESEWIPYPGVTLQSQEVVNMNSILAIACNGSSLIIGGMFDYVNEVQALNIAVQKADGLWYPMALGLSADDEMSNVECLAYDAQQDLLFAGGMFKTTGTITIANNLAAFDGRNWKPALNTELSSWDGPIHVIMTTTHMKPITPSSSPFGLFTLQMMIIIGAVSLCACLSAIILVFFLVRSSRRRSTYISLPQYSEDVRLSLPDLANDAKIKQIPQDEIDLGKRIAHGASGEVLKGSWQGKPVAIKRMSLSTDKAMEDFIYEIKIMSNLKHDNILKFLGVSITKSSEVLLLTEFMEHGSVRDLLDKTAGKIDWKLKIRLAIDAARGMEYLHSCQPSIIHRDLKSSNLLIDKKWKCVIADFGISRLRNMTQYNTLTLTGTPAYMAPEVISDNKYSEKADVYAFGVVLVEIYTGIPPYSEANLFPQQVMYAVVHEGLRPEVPDSCPMPLSVLIQECLDTNPMKRPEFREIKSRLKRL